MTTICLNPRDVLFPPSKVLRLKQSLQETQAERDTAMLDKELLAQRLHNIEQEIDSKRRSQDDRSRQVKALEVGNSVPSRPPFLKLLSPSTVFLAFF